MIIAVDFDGTLCESAYPNIGGVMPDHEPENLAIYGDGGKKVYANVYIDDKNLGGFPGWYETMRLLRAHPDY